jgi:hypothetical protein
MNAVNLSEVDDLQETIDNLDYGQEVIWEDRTYIILADSKSNNIYLHPCGCNPELEDISISELIK